MEQRTFWMGRMGVVTLFVAFLLLPAFMPSVAGSASLDIEPVRLFLDTKTKMDKLLLRNVGDTECPVQLKVYKWTQNVKGEDVYEESKDIIVFPKLLTIKKGDEKIVRIAANVPPGATEKTYRIYVEEMPLPEQTNEGATIRMYMKIGVPVFMGPSQQVEKADIESVAMRSGKLEMTVKNNGNLHFIVTGIAVKGQNGAGKLCFAREIGGWYLLAGSSRTYETSIPTDLCPGISGFDIEVKTNKSVVLKQRLPIDQAMCGKGSVCAGVPYERR